MLPTSTWTANSCKVAAGDFDGDGRTDVAFSHSERAGHAVTWYRSPTPRVAGSWVGHPVAVVDFCHTLQAADWDGDGDTDLLAGGMTQSRHRGLKLLLNGGAGAAWTEVVLQSEGSYSAETGDIDNDGDPDIVGVRNWNTGPSFIYRNGSPAPGGPGTPP
ncbi:MAG: VCBS repeat-containing protein [Planctomycetes bacterium]|nr:VCBS repeat-containing protein [Planctomycetota bacterium]